MTAAVGLKLAQRCGLLGGYVAGADAVALDVVFAKLGADVACEHLQATLCGCIRAHSLAAELAHHGADVDDFAVTFLNHAGDHCLGADVGGDKVYVNHTTEVLDIHLGHGYALDYAGIIDKNIDCAYRSLDVGHHGLDSLLVGNVTEIAFCFYAELLICFESAVYSLLTRAVEYDFCTGFGVCLSYGKAYSIGSSCDEGHFALQ